MDGCLGAEGGGGSRWDAPGAWDSEGWTTDNEPTTHSGRGRQGMTGGDRVPGQGRNIAETRSLRGAEVAFHDGFCRESGVGQASRSILVVRVVPVVCAQGDGGQWTVWDRTQGGNGRRQRDDGIRLWEARFKPQSMTATQVREVPCNLAGLGPGKVNASVHLATAKSGGGRGGRGGGRRPWRRPGGGGVPRRRGNLGAVVDRRVRTTTTTLRFESSQQVPGVRGLFVVPAMGTGQTAQVRRDEVRETLFPPSRR